MGIPPWRHGSSIKTRLSTCSPGQDPAALHASPWASPLPLLPQKAACTATEAPLGEVHRLCARATPQRPPPSLPSSLFFSPAKTGAGRQRRAPEMQRCTHTSARERPPSANRVGARARVADPLGGGATAPRVVRGRSTDWRRQVTSTVTSLAPTRGRGELRACCTAPTAWPT